MDDNAGAQLDFPIETKKLDNLRGWCINCYYYPPVNGIDLCLKFEFLLPDKSIKTKMGGIVKVILEANDGTNILFEDHALKKIFSAVLDWNLYHSSLQVDDKFSLKSRSFKMEAGMDALDLASAVDDIRIDMVEAKEQYFSSYLWLVALLVEVNFPLDKVWKVPVSVMFPNQCIFDVKNYYLEKLKELNKSVEGFVASSSKSPVRSSLAVRKDKEKIWSPVRSSKDSASAKKPNKFGSVPAKPKPVSLLQSNNSICDLSDQKARKRN